MSNSVLNNECLEDVEFPKIQKLIIVGMKRIRIYSFSMIRNLRELILNNIEEIERSAFFEIRPF